MRNILLCAGLFLFIAGCAADAEPYTPSVTTSVAEDLDDLEIHWFEGDVEAAFALAKKQNKPLFLYWGAVWCPPCHRVKNVVFTRPEFIQKTRLFVPVYLDGDTPGAQMAGAQFRVYGYPTLIVFSPTGEELVRLPSGIEVEQYTDALDRALQNVRPIGRIVQAVMTGQSVSEEEYRQLAVHSWLQDLETVPASEQEATFRTLAMQVPAHLKLEATRLYLQYARTVGYQTDEAGQCVPSDPAFQGQAYTRLMDILGDEEQVLGALDYLEFDSDLVVPCVTKAGTPQRDALIQRWRDAMITVEANDQVPTRERVFSLMPLIYLTPLQTHATTTLPDSVLQRIQGRVQWADAVTKNPYSRQSIINASAYLLTEAGLTDEARTLLMTELNVSKSPYYFMDYLADIAKAEGNPKEALDWMSKAYDATKGPATRLEWGVKYIAGLIELTPENETIIQERTLRIFNLYEQKPAPLFYGRNERFMQRLSALLKQWNEKGAHTEAMEIVGRHLSTLCPKAQKKQEACEAFATDWMAG